KHGSWLNIAEIELGVLNRQCMGERIGEKTELIDKTDAWERTRTNATARIDWQFTTADARVKLRRLYPKL
ncbi:MAG: IS630 family transposase, partial [Tepidisphaeraceae bacterium]